MTKRILSVMLACMMVLSLSVFTVSAEENVYYVEMEAGGDGSKDSPFSTIDEAIFELAGEDGTIYILGKYDLTEWNPAVWEGTVTITGGNDDAELYIANGKSAVFAGDVIVKDIKAMIDENAHMNPQGVTAVFDFGDDVEFIEASFFHLGVYGGAVREESHTTFNSGSYSYVYTAGAYNQDPANGVYGDSTVVINGGKIRDFVIGADKYMDTQTGISIGGNHNIIINGGDVARIRAMEQTPPDVMGAINIVFNNGTQAPEQFSYPEAGCGVYVVKSDVGGMVMPTEEPGVFTLKANAGKIAKIGNEKVADGKITFEPGETEVDWVKGNQASVIKLTIDKAEIVKNDVATALDVPAQIINDRTMVPLRAIFEALGATVEWNNETRTVTSEKGDTKISLTIDDTNLYVNGEAKVLDVPAQIVNDRTMVPARAIAEAYGCKVEWDGETRTVTITG